MAKKNTARKSEVVEVTTKTEKVNQVLANENIDKLSAELKTKSAMIRYFGSKGYSRSDIAKAMNIRYQHVRNVLVEEARKNATT